jgi:hypothetical protein
MEELEILASSKRCSVATSLFEKPSPHNVTFPATDGKTSCCSKPEIRVEAPMHDAVAPLLLSWIDLYRPSEYAVAHVATLLGSPLRDRLPKALPIGWHAIGVEEYKRLTARKECSDVSPLCDRLPA